MLRPRFFKTLYLSLAFTLALAACAPVQHRSDPVIGTADGRWPSAETGAPVMTAPQPGAADGNMTYVPSGGVVAAGTLRDPVRVALLVPQSGPNAALGTAIMQAAQLAVFDLNESNFALTPKDTKGTAEGATQAVHEAAREGAKLILGPLFAQEVAAAGQAARSYGLTVVGFSTDWRQAGDNVYSMGVLPFGQTQRIAEFAARQGLRRVAILAPRDLYGDAVLSVFESTAARAGLQIVRTVRMAPDGSDVNTAIQQLTGGAPIQRGTAPYDAIFMPLGGQALHMMASMLKSYGLGASDVRYLGTGLWDDPGVLADPNMAGAFYAAPSPQIRAAFERNYQRIYGSTPPRLASIGYDAAALAIVLARNAATSGGRGAYDRAALTNPNGFSGVDGIFRFSQNGLAERGMAILQVAGGTPRVVEEAPTSFLQNSR